MLRHLKPQFGGVDVNLITGDSTILESYVAQFSDFGLGLPPWALSGALALVNDGTALTSDAC
jgi:hypothetical protein